MCASLKPGVTSLPLRSTVRAAVNWASISRVEPTATMRSPSTATASANVPRASAVKTLPLTSRRLTVRRLCAEDLDGAEASAAQSATASINVSVWRRRISLTLEAGRDLKDGAFYTTFSQRRHRGRTPEQSPERKRAGTHPPESSGEEGKINKDGQDAQDKISNPVHPVHPC